MEKSFIEKSVKKLLDLAAKRQTEQGVQVYAYSLDLLAATNDPIRIQEIKNDLNKALAGIEAHGYLTDQEYAIVRELRKEA